MIDSSMLSPDETIAWSVLSSIFDGESSEQALSKQKRTQAWMEGLVNESRMGKVDFGIALEWDKLQPAPCDLCGALVSYGCKQLISEGQSEYTFCTDTCLEEWNQMSGRSAW